MVMNNNIEFGTYAFFPGLSSLFFTIILAWSILLSTYTLICFRNFKPIQNSG